MGKIIVNAGMAEIDDNKLIVNNPLSVEVGELNSPTKKSIGTREEEQIENSINIDELSERIGKVVGENTKVGEKEEKEKEEEKKEEAQEEKQPDAPNTPEQEESNVLDGEDDMII